MERRENEGSGESEGWRRSRNGDNGVRLKRAMSMDVEWRERIWRGENRESGESEKMERERERREARGESGRHRNGRKRARDPKE